MLQVSFNLKKNKRKCSLTVELALIRSCTYDMAVLLSSYMANVDPVC